MIVYFGAWEYDTQTLPRPPPSRRGEETEAAGQSTDERSRREEETDADFEAQDGRKRRATGSSLRSPRQSVLLSRLEPSLAATISVPLKSHPRTHCVTQCGSSPPAHTVRSTEVHPPAGPPRRDGAQTILCRRRSTELAPPCALRDPLARPEERWGVLCVMLVNDYVNDAPSGALTRPEGRRGPRRGMPAYRTRSIRPASPRASS